MLTQNQIRVLLQLLREKYGPGYSDEVVALLGDRREEVRIGDIQARLSIMLEAATRAGR